MRCTTRPLASISLDLDDKWTYLKTHGDECWKQFPSYLDIVIPRLLSFCTEHQLKLTCFIVGQDAVFERNRALLRSLAEGGHYIGNHSFHHEPWLHLYSTEEVEKEITLAEQWIGYATGISPISFRGPGYSICDTVIEALIKKGYAYDASTFPTSVGALARAYYFRSANLNSRQREHRSKLFGSFRDAFGANSPYDWKTGQGTLLEIPVTTVPILRFPFHLSYLVYLSALSAKLSHAYLLFAMVLCRLRKVEPSFLLHPLDFIGPAEAPELAFFPGMRLPLEHKLRAAASAIQTLRRWFELLPLHEHAERIRERPPLGSSTINDSQRSNSFAARK